MSAACESDQDKERAKRILLEIIRQNGGKFENKTNLFKAFYHAHLSYAEHSSGYLSSWPIVRMPRGPGIHDADTLLGELVLEGLLHIGTVYRGSYEGVCFELTDKADELPAMTPEEADAIQHGVESVAGKTAAKVSAESHAKSRSWNAAADGQELNIYADLSTAEEFDGRKQFFDETAPLIDKVFGQG